MIPPLDPFSLRFDSIELDPGAPVSSALEHALALAAPTAAEPERDSRPGFYLLNDAGGRFVVDRDLGIVSLKDDALLAAERGAVHGVRLRVIEQSGASYDLDMQLRVTGRVPQMVGAEDFSLLAETAPTPDLTPVTRVAFAPPPPRPTVPWSRFTALDGAGGATPISSCGGAQYGALLAAPLPNVGVVGASLVLAEAVPAPAPKSATWTI